MAAAAEQPGPGPPAAPAAAPPAASGARRSKKGRKRARTGPTGELSAEELVRVVPVPRRSEMLLQQEGWRPVQLSKADRAPQAVLSDDRLSVTSAKGFRTVRAPRLCPPPACYRAEHATA